MVVQAKPQTPALDIDTILFLEDRTVLGKVQCNCATVYTRVQVEFFGRENGLKKSTSTYIRENMPQATATSQVTELSK